MSRSPDRARQVTREDVEDVDKVVVEEREGFAIAGADDDNDDNEEEDDTEEGFAIVVVKVVKRAGVAAQAHVR